MEPKVKREPRPKGTTLLAIEYNKLNSDESKQRLIDHVITTYALQGFRYMGQSYSIPALAQKLNIDQKTIMETISNIGTNMGSLANPESLQETLKTIATLSTSFSLSDRGLIQSQLENLLRSQGPNYKPFITAEVNKVLKLMLESNKNLMELYKTFFTTNNTTTNILNLNTNSKEQEDYLTPDKALQILTEQRALPNANNAIKVHKSFSESDTSSLADKLWDKYGIGDLESVKEGRTGTESLRAQEVPEGPRAKKLESPHTNAFERRGEDYEDVDELPTGEA